MRPATLREFGDALRRGGSEWGALLLEACDAGDAIGQLERVAEALGIDRAPSAAWDALGEACVDKLATLSAERQASTRALAAAGGYVLQLSAMLARAGIIAPPPPAGYVPPPPATPREPPPPDLRPHWERSRVKRTAGYNYADDLDEDVPF